METSSQYLVSMAATVDQLQSLRVKFAEHGQDHVFAFLSSLGPDEQATLLSELKVKMLIFLH